MFPLFLAMLILLFSGYISIFPPDWNKLQCYDLKLSLGCNLGKDLSKDERNDQLVKYKDTG